MFCTNCGNMIEEGTAFCTKCGSPVGAVKMQPKRDIQYETKREPVPSKNNENSRDKNGSVLIVVAVIIAILIIVVAVIFALVYMRSEGNTNDEGIGLHEKTTVEQEDRENKTESTSKDPIPDEKSDEQMPEEELRKAESVEIAGTDVERSVEAAVETEKVEQALKSNDDGSDGQYILPDSDNKRISESDLRGLSAWECRIARNEIYARHGRRFADEELQRYFDSKSWYRGSISPDDFTEEMLSEIEKDNRDTIVEYEEKEGYR